MYKYICICICIYKHNLSSGSFGTLASPAKSCQDFALAKVKNQGYLAHKKQHPP